MSRKIIALIIITAFIISISATAVTAYAATSDFHTEDSSIFGEEDSFGELNYGFYWAKKGNLYEKADPKGKNSAYDKNKPTVIFIHGYQADSGYFNRETLASYDYQWINDDDSHYLLDKWIDSGYNVLMYQWNQFSDDTSPVDTKDKIWSLNDKGRIRWRQHDGKYTANDDTRNPDKPISVLFVEDYLELFQGNNSEIRLTGHSMGGMFSVAVMGILYEKYMNKEISGNMLPMRLSLLDPYLGLDTGNNDLMEIYWKADDDEFKTIEDRKIALVCKDYIKKLHELGVAIDYYITTITGEIGLINNMDEKDFDITPYMTTVKYNGNALKNINSLNIGALHCAARDFYFYSFGFDPPIDNSDLASGNYTITASTPSEAVYAASGQYFANKTSNSSLSVEDDDFFKTERNFITIKQRKGIISGFVYVDTNRNGIRDDGPDKGIGEIKVLLYNDKDEFLKETLTDKAGFYSFESSGAGNYYIKFDCSERKNFRKKFPSTHKEGITDKFTLISDSSDAFIGMAMINPDPLAYKNIIIYFIAGLLTVAALTVASLAYAIHQQKKEEDNKDK